MGEGGNKHYVLSRHHCIYVCAVMYLCIHVLLFTIGYSVLALFVYLVVSFSVSVSLFLLNQGQLWDRGSSEMAFVGNNIKTRY